MRADLSVVVHVEMTHPLDLLRWTLQQRPRPKDRVIRRGVYRAVTRDRVQDM